MSNTVILSDAVLAAFEAAAEREYATSVPHARKGGCNPRWPYVPVVKNTAGGVVHVQSTQQILGKAFATREEAVEYAARYIAACKAEWAANLAKPERRALREHCGFAAELKDVVA